MRRALLAFLITTCIALLSGHAIPYVPEDLDFAPISGEQRATPKSTPAAFGRSHVISSINYQMVYVPPGTFMMGSPGNEPDRHNDETQHQVALTKGYYLGVTEVTVGQWRTFAQETGHKSDAEVGGGAQGWSKGVWTKRAGLNWSNPGFNQTDNHPVTCVSWNDAQAFIAWLNGREGNAKVRYRLPMEAEWEYACRAGTKTPFHNGDCLLTKSANYNGNSPLSGCPKGEHRQGTVKVGSFAPNTWGLHDMHGNVWEWCEESYGDYPNGSLPDPKGPSIGSRRVARGGSWGYDAGNCRSANRSGWNPSLSSNDHGFRLAGQ